jgi:excisionase family DNA binding protein
MSALGLPKLLTVKDVMDLLGVKKSYVYDRAASGELPHSRLPGGAIRFDADELRVFLERLKVRPAKVLTLHREP